MGTACCCLNFLNDLKTADWIHIIGLVINSLLAIWIVRTIQKKLTNKRVLKDHFITEIKEIRTEYRTCLNNLYSSSTYPKNVIPWFKLMNIKIDDLMAIINTKYKGDKTKLSPYQNELRELITENEDFIKQYETGKPVNFSEKSKISFVKFQQEHNKLFNEIIIIINDAE